MVAVPMPGLEPGDIVVNIEPDRLSIQGEERGPHQHDRENRKKPSWSRPI